MFERHLVFFDLHRKKIADALGGNQSVDMVLSMYKILVLHMRDKFRYILLCQLSHIIVIFQ